MYAETGSDYTQSILCLFDMTPAQEMNIKQQYGVIIRCRIFDGERIFEARFREFPDLASYADSLDRVYDLAYDALEVSLSYLGASAPKPVLDD